ALFGTAHQCLVGTVQFGIPALGVPVDAVHNVDRGVLVALFVVWAIHLRQAGQWGQAQKNRNDYSHERLPLFDFIKRRLTRDSRTRYRSNGCSEAMSAMGVSRDRKALPGPALLRHPSGQRHDQYSK